MIRNLNAITFQEFGSVLSERPQNSKNTEKETGALLLLDGTQASMYRTKSQTQITCGNAMIVLSVSYDGMTFWHFCLDKSVYLKEGIFYSLNPFEGKAAVRVCADAMPEAVEEKNLQKPWDIQQLAFDRKLRVEGIHTFFYQEKEQGFLFSGESHPILELTYVDQGSMHSVVEGQDILMKQGDLVIYGPNQWHMQYADIGVAPRYVTITFDLSVGDLSPLLNRKFTAPQHTVTILQKMLQEQERMDDFSSSVIVSQLEMLLLLLLREDKTPRAGKLQTSNAVHSENEIIRQAQQYISSHIREKLSVPLVARQVDVSPSYLTALFHKNLQISPGEYIRRTKLQESKQMIRENNLNFTEIAAELQYSTVHHFSRQFKEKFGITPTEYAKSVR
ncbi:MAG: helix-turn-helix transcriptional regulator [Oscillospiraceae bacterium]|nr:helix-turn-helix transcriptional regulator [Oscillospiraceae bacterium]